MAKEAAQQESENLIPRTNHSKNRRGGRKKTEEETRRGGRVGSARLGLESGASAVGADGRGGKAETGEGVGIGVGEAAEAEAGVVLEGFGLCVESRSCHVRMGRARAMLASEGWRKERGRDDDELAAAAAAAADVFAFASLRFVSSQKYKREAVEDGCGAVLSLEGWEARARKLFPLQFCSPFFLFLLISFCHFRALLFGIFFSSFSRYFLALA